MIDHNCAVALATDFNPGSCYSESIPLIFALATLYMDLSIGKPSPPSRLTARQPWGERIRSEVWTSERRATSSY